MGDGGHVTRVRRNQNFAMLGAGYLFPEVARRRRAFQERNPGAKVISLDEIKAEDWTLNISRYVLSSVGDEIPPLPEAIAAFKQALSECRVAEDHVREVLTEGGWMA